MSGAVNKPRTGTRRKRRDPNRSFGLLFAAVFAFFTFWPMIHGGTPVLWLLVPGLAFLVAALAAPRLLGPLNVVWMRFSVLLHRVMTPVIMTLLYFGVVCPMALIIRAAGRDVLHLKREPQSATYWIARVPPGPDPTSMSNQF